MAKQRFVWIATLAGAVCLSACGSKPAPARTRDWRDEVLYHLVVDRFANGAVANDGSPVAAVEPAASWQGGDLEGVRQAIEAGYFNDLGVTALWLTSPVLAAPESGMASDGHLRAGYLGTWPSDLGAVEPRLGSMAELRGVVDAAHRRGLRVVLDYTMNHVHQSASVYSAHPDWFWPSLLGGQPCICGQGCSWSGPEGKRCWIAPYLPDFNFTVAEARQFSIGNVVWWMQQTGADGVRLDRVGMVEDRWLTDLRTRLASDVDPALGRRALVLGETVTGDTAAVAAPIDPTRLDGQLDWPLRARIVEAMLLRTVPMTELAAFLDANDGAYDASAVMATFLGNHWVPRAIHLAEDTPAWTDPWSFGADRAWANQPALPAGTAAFERLANAFALLFTTKGLPVVYYGDEVGQPGAGDPDNQRFMAWSGYTAGQALLLDRVKALGAARAALPVLRRGTRTTLSATEDTMAFEMREGGDAAWVVLNRGDVEATVSGLPAASFTDRLGGGPATGPTVTVPARSAMILVRP